MRVIILILFFTNSLFGQILQIGSIDDNGRVYFNSKIITLPDSVDQILLKYSENERAGTRYKFEVFEEKSIILKSYKFEVEIIHTLDRCSNRVRSYSTYKIHFGKSTNGDFLKKDSLSSFFDENTELMVYEDLLKEQLRFLYKKFALEYSLSTILKNIANGYVSTYDFESKRTKSIKFSDTLITVPVNTVRKLSSTEINLIKDILYNLKNQIYNNESSFMETHMFLFSDNQNKFLAKFDISEMSSGYRLKVKLRNMNYAEYGRMFDTFQKFDEFLNK